MSVYVYIMCYSIYVYIHVNMLHAAIGLFSKNLCRYMYYLHIFYVVHLNKHISHISFLYECICIHYVLSGTCVMFTCIYIFYIRDMYIYVTYLLNMRVCVDVCECVFICACMCMCECGDKPSSTRHTCTQLLNYKSELMKMYCGLLVNMYNWGWKHTIESYGVARLIRCLIFIGHVPQKKPIISGSFAKEMTCDLRHPMIHTGWRRLIGRLKSQVMFPQKSHQL